MNKKYVVEPTEAERERLLKLLSSGSTAPARMLNRARVLLKADDADGPDRWTDERIARALNTSAATVGRVRKRFCRQGLEAALERWLPDRVYERSVDGRAEARLIALACSEAPEGRELFWSMRLLADKKAVELGIVQRVSHERRSGRRSKKRAPPAPGEGVGDPAPKERRRLRLEDGGRARPLRGALRRRATGGGVLRRAPLPAPRRPPRATAGRRPGRPERRATTSTSGAAWRTC